MALSNTAVVKLIYEATGAAVKAKDHVNTDLLGTVIVTNIHAPRKKAGSGRISLTLPDGTKGDFNPAVIGAKWTNG